MASVMLVREGQTDLTPFSPPDLSLAHSQWLLELSARIDLLQAARSLSIDLDYGGTTTDADIVAPLEEAVDEARRMVCALGGEMRRRSDGCLPVWLVPPPAHSGPSGPSALAGAAREGMVRAASAI